MKRTVIVLLIILLGLCILCCLLGVLDSRDKASTSNQKENMEKNPTENNEGTGENALPNNELLPNAGEDFDNEQESPEHSETVSPIETPLVTEPTETDPPTIEPPKTEQSEQANNGNELPPISADGIFE